MDYELTVGKALVIVGPKGCGKTKRARELAKKHGRFVEIDSFLLETRQGLNDCLASEPAVVVCEGFPTSEDGRGRLMEAVSGRPLLIEMKYRPAKQIVPPAFIFVARDINLASLSCLPETFRVIQIGDAA